MIEVEYCKPKREIVEYEIFFVLDAKHDMYYCVEVVDNYVIDYHQNTTDSSIHANHLTNEQRMEIDTYINEYNYQ